MGTVKLIHQYRKLCFKFSKRFCKKQGLNFESLSVHNNNIFLNCSGETFQMEDIFYDIRSKRPKGMILDWKFSGRYKETYYDYTLRMSVQLKPESEGYAYPHKKDGSF